MKNIMINRVFRHIYDDLKQKNRFICFAIFVRGNNSRSDSLIISSETRGGSTWLAELIVAHIPAAIV